MSKREYEEFLEENEDFDGEEEEKVVENKEEDPDWLKEAMAEEERKMAEADRIFEMRFDPMVDKGGEYEFSNDSKDSNNLNDSDELYNEEEDFETVEIVSGSSGLTPIEVKIKKINEEE